MTPERARDALGRPLPGDADADLVAEPLIDVKGASDAEIWATATAYLSRGLPFHAHEVFEQRWRTCDPRERDAWRALAQWGAALTHAARGNTEGSQRLAERALATLASAERVPTCIDVEAVQHSCQGLVRA